MPRQPDLSIVVPAYAEAPLIVLSLRRLADHLSRLPTGSAEVIVVVADAGDGTLALARHCVPWFERCLVIDAGPRAGKGRDVRLGMLAARGRYRVFMDADLATPLHHLDELAPHMGAHAEVVIGVRDLWRTHRGRRRRAVTTGGNLLVRTLLLPGFRDTQCGFKMFRADVCEAVFQPATVDGWGFDLEVLVSARRLGYRIDTLAINDWQDPKPASQGLGSDSTWRAARQVLVVLIRLRLRMWRRRTAGLRARPLSTGADRDHERTEAVLGRPTAQVAKS